MLSAANNAVGLQHGLQRLLTPEVKCLLLLVQSKGNTMPVHALKLGIHPT